MRSGQPSRLGVALRVLAWRARPLLLCLALVGGCALAARAAAPPPAPTAAVVVADGDLRAGHRLAATDLRTVRLPKGLVPGGAARDPADLVGLALAVDVPRGLPLVAAHLGGSRFARTPPAGTVAVPVRLGDGEVAGFLRPGDRVDLVASAGWVEEAAGPRVLASAALVLEVRAGDGNDGGLGLVPAGGEPEPVVVVAVSPADGHLIAAAEVGSLGAVLVQGS